MQYELFYLIGASKEAGLEKIKSEVKEIVASEGGVFEAKEIIEKRKLAYKIKRETHGSYVGQRFELENPEKVQSITKKLNLYPEILRFLVSKASELPELKSKEERMKQEAALKPAKKEKEEASAKVLAGKKAEEDIDKKLEEILNI